MAAGLLARADRARASRPRQRSPLDPLVSRALSPRSPLWSADTSSSPRRAPRPAPTSPRCSLRIRSSTISLSATSSTSREPRWDSSAVRWPPLPSACSPSAWEAICLRRRGHLCAANLTLAAATVGHPAGRARGPRPLLSHPRLQGSCPRHQPGRPPTHRPDHSRRRAHLRLFADLLHPPSASPDQRQRQRPLVRRLLARLAAHLRDRRHASPTLGRPGTHLPVHLQSRRTHPGSRALRPLSAPLPPPEARPFSPIAERLHP